MGRLRATALSGSAMLLAVVLARTSGAADSSAAAAPKAVAPDAAVRQPWLGDLDGMRRRGYIRVLVPYNRTFFFYDGPQPRGFAYDIMTEFERQIAGDSSGAAPLRVVFIPMQRDRFVPDIVAGNADVAMAGLTVTPEREQQVAFVPYEKTISEVVVHGADAPPLASLDDLSGRSVFVRRSSSYYQSLVALSSDFERSGRPAIDIVAADENLETEDILDLVNAGVVPITLCDLYLARTWAPLLRNLRVRTDLATRTGAQLGPIIRKQSPQLKAALQAFIATHGPGSAFGNALVDRYTAGNEWIRNPNATEERKRLEATLPIFAKYGKEYGFDELLLAAQAYEESGLHQELRGPDGGVGVTQITEVTASNPNVAIPDVRKLDDNIHAGVKYLRYVTDRYFSDAHFDELNRQIFAFAAYNAGPVRVQKLRTEAAREGYDDNVWFNNVEIVAARDVGREPVDYVRNILKYWVAYRLLQPPGATPEPTKPSQDRGDSAVAR
jgi:membrane-bound lytic murein transglycosylase MltF